MARQVIELLESANRLGAACSHPEDYVQTGVYARGVCLPPVCMACGATLSGEGAVMKIDDFMQPIELPAPRYGYVAFYKGQRIELYAPSQLAAQREAAKQFGAKRAYEVSVALAEKDGVPVVQVAE